MSGTVSIVSLESDALTALRSFLLSILPAGTEVVRGQDNRVPEPNVDNYVVMTTMLRTRLSTNFISYNDNSALIPGSSPESYTSGIRYAMQSTQLTVQLDVHGTSATDNCQIIATLFRDDYACTAMATAPVDVQPLYTSEPRQMPFINGEDQYEDRWSIDAQVQVNPIVSTPQQFAHALAVGLIAVDANYPVGA